jgi:hypothetical protein
VANETELAAAIILGVLGAFGGVPQILRWLKPKPRLKITAADISRLQAENYKYQVHLEVENQTRLWRRNGDATNVTADYYVVDKDGVQCVAALGLMLSQYLCADAKIRKELEAYHSLTPDGNPFSVIFKVSCTEGASARKVLAYEASPIVYT